MDRIQITFFQFVYINRQPGLSYRARSEHILDCPLTGIVKGAGLQRYLLASFTEFNVPVYAVNIRDDWAVIDGERCGTQRIDTDVYA